MTEWYQRVGANAPLTQGDILFDFPIGTWGQNDIPTLSQENATDFLSSQFTIYSEDVIVMTQACDLEQNKVNHVILCPHVSLEQHRQDWVDTMKNQGQNPSEKAWKKICDSIKDGYQWNYFMLNATEIDGQKLQHRVVDFHDIYSLPRQFIQKYLQQQARFRFRLLPPYREHLSQSFARYFMRVGLPTPIEKVW